MNTGKRVDKDQKHTETPKETEIVENEHKRTKPPKETKNVDKEQKNSKMSKQMKETMEKVEETSIPKGDVPNVKNDGVKKHV